jgi:hypothetical protein
LPLWQESGTPKIWKSKPYSPAVKPQVREMLVFLLETA